MLPARAPTGYGAAHLAMAGYLRARDASRPVRGGRRRPGRCAPPRAAGALAAEGHGLTLSSACCLNFLFGSLFPSTDPLRGRRQPHARHRRGMPHVRARAPDPQAGGRAGCVFLFSFPSWARLALRTALLLLPAANGHLPTAARLAACRPAPAGETRPVVLCEYSHSMGNSTGNIHAYWAAFEAHPHLQVGAWLGGTQPHPVRCTGRPKVEFLQPGPEHLDV